MLKLNEQNFKAEISGKKIVVMFYRESGCSFCDKAKPIFEAYQGNEKGMYALGQVPDSINEEFPIERFPTFYAFEDGKVAGKFEGVPTHEKLDALFKPGETAKPTKIEDFAMPVLVSDELLLIDQIAKLKGHLNAVQAEIKKRRELAGL